MKWSQNTQTKPPIILNKTHCYFDFLNTGMNVQHCIITWADDGFVLYNHYLSNKQKNSYLYLQGKKECAKVPNIVAQECVTTIQAGHQLIFVLEVIGQVTWPRSMNSDILTLLTSLASAQLNFKKDTVGRFSSLESLLYFLQRIKFIITVHMLLGFFPQM